MTCAAGQLALRLEPEDDSPTLQKPRTRGECANVPRPCPFASCAHNLLLKIGTPDVQNLVKSKQLALVQTRWGHEDFELLKESCALDFADRGEHTDEEIGEALNVTGEAVRQTIKKALIKLEARPKTLGEE